MAIITRTKNWIDRECLTHTDLNAEFSNITNNIIASDLTNKGMIERATDAEVVDGTDEERAVTPAGMLARTGTTARIGLVQLEDSHTSVLTTKAACPKNVKEAYDLAGTMLTKATFDANTFIYAVNDNTPVIKNRAEVMALLSGQAGADFALNTHKITGLVDPTADQEAATKKYVDDNAGSDVPAGSQGDMLYKGASAWLAGKVIINIASYGASPSESAANNTTYIQNAINAAEAASPSAILVPIGVFQINGTLTMESSDIELAGVSRSGSVIQQTANQVAIVVGQSAADIGNVTISNLHLRDTSAHTASIGIGVGKVGSTKGVHNLVIRDVRFGGFDIGIKRQNNRAGGFQAFQGLTFEGYDSHQHRYGMYSDVGWGVFNVNNCFFHECEVGAFYIKGTNAIAGSGVGDFTMTGNQIDGSPDSFGIYINKDGSDYGGNFNITGNKIDGFAGGTSSYPIYINDCTGFKVLGNSYAGGADLADKAVTLVGTCTNYVIDREDRSGINEYGFEINGSPPKIILERPSVGAWDMYVNASDSIIIGDAVSGNGITITNAGNLTATGSCCGADYVFEDGYKLKTLPELSAYVGQNESLPGITFTNNDNIDFNLAIEELTVKTEEQALYILQLHERLKTLEIEKA